MATSQVHVNASYDDAVRPKIPGEVCPRYSPEASKRWDDACDAEKRPDLKGARSSEAWARESCAGHPVWATVCAAACNVGDFASVCRLVTADALEKGAPEFLPA